MIGVKVQRMGAGKMYKGFILSESLENPTILNDYKTIYVKVENHPESESPYWHDFKVEIEDIESAMKSITKELKYGWYAHFWNDEYVYVAFPNKYFRIPREENWSSPEYKQVVSYGTENGVEKQYLENFWIED